jgi:2'-hydroxyisoflavone reductase
MKILLVGGTRFLGRFVVERALERGHQVTLFHRGQTQPGLFPECERILGDRERDLDRLDGRTWDAVVDTCGFTPRAVADIARRLEPRVGHYTFVSSISVYADPVLEGIDETAPLAMLEDPASEEITGATYGGLKALCEQAAEAAMPGRVLNVRAGLLIGPWDYMDRFTYWVRRFAEGGDVLVPDAAHQPMQWIDVRDAAAWMIAQAEAGTSGPFNLTGPRNATTLGAFFASVAAIQGGRSTLVPVAKEFLLERKVTPWSELPFWIPDGAGLLAVNIGAAAAAGLESRPLATSVRDTWAWLEGEGRAVRPSGSVAASPASTSLSRERERSLLSEWAARSL